MTDRRTFLASLFAPFFARFGKKPAWTGIDTASGESVTVVEVWVCDFKSPISLAGRRAI
jgi:hypothetical protein